MSDLTNEIVLKALADIVDPSLGKDIVSLGVVKNLQIEDARVSCEIQLAMQGKNHLKKQAIDRILEIPGVKEANVEIVIVKGNSVSGNSPIPGIKNIIPISSAKGGVGKSTVSANLAMALSKTGAKVGLMDADIYGPSIPTLLNVTESPTPKDNNVIIPVEKYGIKVMSMGFFLPKDKAVIWRGPMLNKMITQFLKGVDWGELDYLLIDLPPGTGDVQLTLCQQVPLTGAVIVSTPQIVALNIAKKGMAMFQQLNCPLIGIIENMSYYQIPDGEKDYIFGEGGAKKFAEELDLPFLGEIPIATSIRKQSDIGIPIVESEPESSYAKAFIAVAEKLASQINAMHSSGDVPQEIKLTF
ncbi:Mrp/NBP35 family ATP-binding protein [Candidatus Uabimicrobium sp. HlEnr_7]|uniref:Mrp/NBP35 family ATP-binding protein n=1 Tax=Candidatus Uabimicrobium helgolandensis TaxID=3095367 RepID=UPI0035591919